MSITPDIKDKFFRLAGDLSPENLTCDGELSDSQVAKKYKALKKEWVILEKKVGRAVSEDEVWNWYIEDNNL